MTYEKKKTVNTHDMEVAHFPKYQLRRGLYLNCKNR